MAPAPEPAPGGRDPHDRRTIDLEDWLAARAPSARAAMVQLPLALRDPPPSAYALAR